MDPEKAMANPGQPPMAQPPMGQPYMGQPYMGQTSAPPPYNVQQAEPGQAYLQVYRYQSYGGGYGRQPYPVGQQYPAQLGAVTVQPAVFLTQAPLANPVNDYMGFSIFTMICCFLPVGVAALIFSLSTRDANRSGNQAEAERSSNLAKILNYVALGIGIGIIVIAIIIVGVSLGYAYSLV